jgi:acetylornithine deacetylase
VAHDPATPRISPARGWSGSSTGPGGRYNTIPDERVELVDRFNAARVYAKTIVEVCS